MVLSGAEQLAPVVNARDLPLLEFPSGSLPAEESLMPPGIPTEAELPPPRSEEPLDGWSPPAEAVPVAAMSDPLRDAALSVRPDEVEGIYERVLDLFPNGQDQLIERVRQAELETQVGVDTTDESWVHVKDSSITWGGRVHADYVNWANDSQFNGQPDYVEFRRLRLYAAGEGYGVYDYQLDLAFAPEFDIDNTAESVTQLGSIEVKDAYIGMRDIPLLGYVRLGHVRTPFSLEQLTSSNYLTFLERSLAHRLAPGREIGLVAYNHTRGKNVTWAYGAFFDDLPEEAPHIEEDNQGVRAIGRLTWTPWYDVPSDGRYMMHTGVSAAYARHRLRENPDLPGTFLRALRFNARPEIHRGDSLIDTGLIDASESQVLDIETALVRGPLSLQSELVWARIDEEAGVATDMYGAYAQLSWFLTGEHRPYDRQWARFERVIPYENFWMVCTPSGVEKGWGAWELAARWSLLEFPDFSAQKLQDLTVGMNWYWNPQTRMMLNWIHTWATNSPESPLANAEGDIVSLRWQVDF
jgi:phosphate-selective porin OprO/OprP